jgi:hypothetical protein
MRTLEPSPDDPDFMHGPPGQSAVNAAVEEDTASDVDKIKQLVRELDLSGGTANVFRQAPGRAEHDFVGEHDVDSFSLENVKRVYGGGKYLIKLKAASGRFVKTLRFSVDPRIVGEIDKPMQQTTPTGDTNTLLMMMLKSGEERAARAEDAARVASERMAQMQVGMMTTVVTLMSEAGKANAQMLAAIMGRQTNVTPVEPSSRLVEVMMPLFLENLKPKNGLGELVETVKVVKELSGGTPAEEPREDMLDKIMKVGGPVLAAVLSRNQPIPPVPTPVPTPQPAPNPTARPLPESQAQAKVRELIGQLRLVTPALVRAASRNGSIDAYMEVLDNTLDDESWTYLVAFLQRDDWVSTLFGDHPGVTQHKPWFDNFRETVLHEATETETDSQDQPATDQGQSGMVP